MIKMYNTAPVFRASAEPPVHLATVDGAYYFAFPSSVTPPDGGQDVTDLTPVLANSDMIRDVKRECARRIQEAAPMWQQQNALSDVVTLSAAANLTTDQQEALTKAQKVLDAVQQLRTKSNDIEAALLAGQLVDFMAEDAWQSL